MSAPDGVALEDKRALAPCLVCCSCVGPSYRIPTEQQYAVMDQLIQISNLMNSIQQTEPHLRLLCAECAKMCDRHVPSSGSAAASGQPAPSTSGSATQAFPTESVHILGRSDPPLPQFATLLSPQTELVAHPADVEMLADYESAEQPDAEQYGVPLEPLVGTEVLLGSEPGEQPLPPPPPPYQYELQSHSHSPERATEQRSEMEDGAPPAPAPVATAASVVEQVNNGQNQPERTVKEALREKVMRRQLKEQQETASNLPAVGAAPAAGTAASVGPPAERSRPAGQQEPLDFCTRNQQLQQHQQPGGNGGPEPGAASVASVGASQEGTLAAVQQEPLDYSMLSQQLQQYQSPVGASLEGTLGSADQQEPLDFSMLSQQQQQQPREVQQPNGNVAAAGSLASFMAWRDALCYHPAVLQALVGYCSQQQQLQLQQYFGGPAAGAEIPPGNLVLSETTQQLLRQLQEHAQRQILQQLLQGHPSQQLQQHQQDSAVDLTTAQAQQQESRGDNLQAAGGRSTGGNEQVAENWPSAGPSQQPQQPQQQHVSSSMLDAAPGNSANRTADVAVNGAGVEPPLELLQQIPDQQHLRTDNPAVAAAQPADLSRRPRGRRPAAGAPSARRNSRSSGNQRSSCAHQADADRYTDARGPLLEPFVCAHCNVTYVNFYAFRQHMFTTHGLLACQLCRRRVHVFVYESHVEQCYRQTVYCVLCRSGYHRAGVSGPRPVEANPGGARPPPPPGKKECQFCGRYFSKYYVLRHIRAKHPDASE